MKAPRAVRTARLSDIPAIQDVARATWTATYEHLIPAPVQARALAAWYSSEGLARWLKEPTALFLVAASNDGVVGFAQFALESPTAWELSRLYVRPAFQREGIGAQLLGAGLVELERRGCTLLAVTVERENGIGRGFYRKHGFRETSEGALDIMGHAVSVVKCEKEL